MEPTRLFDLINYQLKKFPQQDALAYKVEGSWTKFSTEELQNIANKVSLGLLKSGITKGDKIAIISPNRPEWNFIDYGVQQIGAVSVPIYPSVTEEDYKFIFNDSEVKMIFVANQEICEKTIKALAQLPQTTKIYTFDKIENQKIWKEIMEVGEDAQLLEVSKASVLPDDIITLIYTSGTTGNPKGVMLSHNNILSNVKSCALLMPVDEQHRALSFLPLCHIYERMLNYLYTYCGVSIYYAESLETISDNLKELKPHIFVTVPRLLEKVYDKIYTKGAALTGIKKTLFFWALDLGLQYEINKSSGWWYDLQLTLANKLVFNKWREALGGNIRAIVSGGAALQPRLAKVFWAARIRILEGYGLTETSPVICVNRADAKENRIGTVGPAIPGVEVKLAHDGEILSRGPHIMKGYYRREDLTAESLDKEGWFHTGDIGEFVEGRYLKITDRKKEIFKTSGGKYIAPQLIENKFKESRIIEQIMIIGEGQKFPAALIVPSFSGLRTWCEIKGIRYTTNEEMITKKVVIEKFQKEMDLLNQHFAQYEKVKKFELLLNPWTVDSGEMTPTLKLKRKIILANNTLLIERIYAPEDNHLN
jgi:long-chain acyl-CoA synthetase